MLSVKPKIQIVDKGEFGLYVHWPFCKSKCPYCDFNSHVREQIDQKIWAEALVTELKYFAEMTKGQKLSSIFFGGGTPSLMSPKTVQAVIDAAQSSWHFINDIEITLEANPTSIEAKKFKDFKVAGVNRVSIGVQSFIDDDLKALGREHSATEAKCAIEIADDTFDRYSFDLIYARENQNLSNWERELSDALNFTNGHISLYQLTIEPGTAFHTRFKRGDLTVPDDEDAAEFYNLTQDITSDFGLPAYETSNHASAGQESRHNLIYWNYGSYAGIGPGAHGRILTPDSKRLATRTHLAPEIWLKRVQENNYGAHPFETVSPREQAEEWLMMGLRLAEGVCINDCKNLTGYNFDDLIDPRQFDLMQREEFLIYDQTTDILKTTAQGALCLNAILGRIINDAL